MAVAENMELTLAIILLQHRIACLCSTQEHMIRVGMIRPSVSQMFRPVCLLAGRGGEWRLSEPTL